MYFACQNEFDKHVVLCLSLPPGYAIKACFGLLLFFFSQE